MPNFYKVRSTSPQPASQRIIVIGASTGGPQALRAILTQFRADFPVPILCVQHITHGFLQGLVDWLSSQCRIRVKVVQPPELPEAGKVYFPKEGTHLEIDRTGRLSCSSTSLFKGFCPSVTVSLNSVARYYGSAAIGVLLTGMGSDGAEGMQAITQAGGSTIAQDEESSVVFGMPKQAIELGAVQHVLPVSNIASKLMSMVETRT